MNSEHDEFDLKSFFLWCWKGRTWLIMSALISTLAFAVAAILIRPVYRATTVVVSSSSEKGGLSGNIGSTLGSLGGLASLAGIDIGKDLTSDEVALAVLQSRQFIEDFIEAQGLLPLLYPKKWDTAHERWIVPVGQEPTLAKASRTFLKKRLEVTRDRKSGLTGISVDWYDPNLAAQWSNNLVEKLNTEMRHRTMERTEKSVTFLREELDRTQTVDTRDAINKLLSDQIRERMLANVAHDYAFRIVDRALPPDKRDVLRPSRITLLLLGPLVGLLLGILSLMMRDALRS